MKEIMIYTDGACSGNPGPGGWGAVLFFGQHKKEISGGEKYTTNNRMEIQAVIEALQILKEPCKAAVYSDSAYVVNCFQNNWIRGWLRNGWKNSKGHPVENQDLWQSLWGLMQIHKVT
ncbi:ribonuclease HI [Paenibacillus cellulosilyticus]|uniref:ribonuclease H n=1 Tax=Paenibacillus cellulosilyticus TaxID=375489 RepID=A0A2V2YP67_9BACL|nr:ribonuclease HI [Paenibacillus cellulosilyticus]